MTKERLALGKQGEDLAYKRIRRLGYKKIIRNYSCQLGEIDLIAYDGDVLVFLEIKTRKGRSTEYAKAAVNARKQHQISKVALFYLKSNGLEDIKARFDVVAVCIDKSGLAEVELIRDAFDLAY